MSEDRAARVADLSQAVVRAAELLEEAERIMADVRGALDDLGLSGAFREELEAFTLPSAVAERLQDKLDRLAGELDNRAQEPPAGADDTQGALGDEPGLLQPPDPVESERLQVQCPACHRRFTSPVAGDPRELDSVSIDGRTYRCPHCGHTECYETWDHFVS
ncbi:MAG: hypothetical protein M3357_07420 [Actinomycetota bacterium]|nr:hypothetical protein [Actinomycetota bacterium]